MTLAMIEYDTFFLLALFLSTLSVDILSLYLIIEPFSKSKTPPTSKLIGILPSPAELSEEEFTEVDTNISEGEKTEALEGIDRDLLEEGFERGCSSIYKDGKKVAFLLLEFSTSRGARNSFKETIESTEGEDSYKVSLGDESVGIYKESTKTDLVIFRIGNILASSIIGSIDESEKNKESFKFAQILERKIEGTL